jgi:hypothetical protein
MCFALPWMKRTWCVTHNLVTKSEKKASGKSKMGFGNEGKIWARHRNPGKLFA